VSLKVPITNAGAFALADGGTAVGRWTGLNFTYQPLNLMPSVEIVCLAEENHEVRPFL
jgi:hypothetical protein